MKVGIVSHYVKSADYDPGNEEERHRIEISKHVVEDLVEYLEEKETEYFINRECARVLSSTKGVRIEEMGVDVILTVGGDGTILRTINRLPHQIPILGINTGRVGFLAEISPENATDAVDYLLDGFETESRARLSVTVNGEYVGSALNETVIVTSRPAKIMEFDVHHGGELVESVRCDGIVVATPTGSTAYSMSAGGPLVDPTVESFLVVPLAPYRMSVSPWVLNSHRPIKITPTRVDKEGAVVIDGIHTTEVGAGDELTFERDETDAIFVKTDKTFFEKVREKLS